jgi:hypothetical protein
MVTPPSGVNHVIGSNGDLVLLLPPSISNAPVFSKAGRLHLLRADDRGECVLEAATRSVIAAPPRGVQRVVVGGFGCEEQHISMTRFEAEDFEVVSVPDWCGIAFWYYDGSISTVRMRDFIESGMPPPSTAPNVRTTVQGREHSHELLARETRSEEADWFAAIDDPENTVESRDELLEWARQRFEEVDRVLGSSQRALEQVHTESE